MKPKVYSISGAPRSWRILVALTLKGVDHEASYLSGSDREHRQPHFLKINPHGKVPVFEDAGVQLRESLAILALLDETYPDRPLLGSTVPESRHIWKITALLSDYLPTAVSDVVGPAFDSDGTPPEKGSKEDAQLKAAAQLLHVELRQLEALLADEPFLCGKAPTGAEAIAFPEVGRIMRANETRKGFMAAAGLSDFDVRYPGMAAWHARLMEIPGIAETFPPHWQQLAA